MVNIIWLMMVNNNLVGGGPYFSPTPLKNDGVSSSLGMMKFPTEWKNNPNVPNHQSVFLYCKSILLYLVVLLKIHECVDISLFRIRLL